MKGLSRGRRALLIVVGVLLGSWAGSRSLPVQARNTIKTYTLHVEAAAATESDMVSGAFWVDGSERRADVIRQVAPFDVRMTGDTVVAIVKTENGRPIRADLMEAGRSVTSGIGASVVVVQGLGPNVDWRFVKTF